MTSDSDEVPLKAQRYSLASALSYWLKHKTDLSQLCLTVLTLILFVLVAVLSIWGEVPRDLWVVAGLSCMLLIILSERQGAAAFVAILAISTLVAREEFLLEVTALSRGESLADLRGSRVVATNELSDDEEGDSVLIKQKLNDLIAAKKSGDQIFQELEQYRIDLDVARDISRINNTTRILITHMFHEGGFSSKNYRVFLKEKELEKEVADDSLEELMGSGYATLIEAHGETELTEKGFSLAKAMGLKKEKNEP